VIAARRLQRSFADGFIAEEIKRSVGTLDAARRWSAE
jgi:hypothetical protein